MDHTIDAEPTFEPFYAGRELVLPPDARTDQERALRAFGRKCRVERIRANVAMMPSRSMFAWPDETRAA